MDEPNREAGGCPPIAPVFKRIMLIVTGIRGYEEGVRQAGALASVFHAEVLALAQAQFGDWRGAASPPPMAVQQDFCAYRSLDNLLRCVGDGLCRMGAMRKVSSGRASGAAEQGDPPARPVS